MGHVPRNGMPQLVLPPPAINQLNHQFLNAPLPVGQPLIPYGNDNEEEQQQQQQQQQQQPQPRYMDSTVSSRAKRRRGGKRKKRKTRRKKRKSRRKTRKKRRRKSRKKRKTRRRKKGGMPGRIPNKLTLKKSPRVLNLQQMAKKKTHTIRPPLKKQPSQGLEQSLEDELAHMTVSSNTGSNQ